MIFEASPGLFYQYSADENCWVRVDGLDALGVATPLKDGLMSKEDLRKVNDLIIPPPRITLTGEDCNFTFDEGTVGFRSSEGHLHIDNELELRNQVGETVIVEKVPWQIHENTFGYDFRVDMDKLLEEMEARGHLTYRGTTGEQGEKGETGDAGIDDLETGPQGPDGADGANAQFPGTLSREPSTFEISGETNRAVVDIRAEKSGDDNYLVMTRANIGNLEACPGLVRPKKFTSPLVLAIDDNPERARFKKEITQDDCVKTCAICSTLHFFDIDPVLDQVFDRFKELVLQLKESKEALTNNWLRTMISVFNEQRDAICCALENCESRKRNQDERRYIEQQRIQAAQADFALEIDGVDDREIVDMDNISKGLPTPECPEEGGEANPGVPDCIECEMEFIIDGRLNSPTIDQAVLAHLPAGDYVGEITGCCISVNPSQGYLGRIRLQYIAADGPKELVTPNLGVFPDLEDAKDAYLGIKFAFTHVGGEVRAWFPDSFVPDNSGSITVCIKAASCFEFTTDPTGQDFTVFPPPETCEMPASQVQWYERGWRIGACCGAWVSSGGIQWIVVKRSIGVDVTCGGGESLTTQCIADFINSGKGHPAIAMPTLDGEEFIGKPLSGTQQFTEDEDLSAALLAKINGGLAKEVKGDPSQIPLIIFPSFSPTDGHGNLLVGPGTGLAGEYFNGFNTFSAGNLVFTRRDPNVDFVWNGPPDDPRIGGTNYSVRWTGEVRIPSDGDYTFFTIVDDGCKLTIEGAVIIDALVAGPPRELSGAKTLTAGWHTIELKYTQGPLEFAMIRLLYESPSTVKQIIPEENLRLT
jgi:hypothetical protein